MRLCYTEPMTAIEISGKEHILIQRAGLHALKNPPPHLRFRHGVDDLDAARLIHRLERGAVIVPTDSGRAWHEIPTAPRFLHFTIVVQECLRLGLVRRDSIVTGRDRRRIQLAAAPVHLRHPRVPWQRTCVSVRGNRDQRFRLTDDPKLVDCLTCLGVHR